ncbi:MAG TPA: hypothetical protein VKG92_03710 [Flavobacteriales bacterium]|nr:hypothetical protein [Flavobacteriales bacterium]
MITTNLLQLVRELDRLGAVRVSDHSDTIELHVSKPVDLDKLDDLVCDALFVDPLDRREDMNDWTIKLYKREHLRGSSDMDVKPLRGRTIYIVGRTTDRNTYYSHRS